MANLELNSILVGGLLNMSYIKRAIEELVQSNFLKSKSLAITGARQVGKTTLTQHIFPEMKRINMKSNQLISFAKDDPYSFLKNYKTPLFVDEVQSAPFLLDEVKVILDETNNRSNYIFSGSSKWSLMKGLSESLAGMVSILELTTLSMREIKGVGFNEPFSLNDKYLISRERRINKYEDIWNYIHRGFYPELYDDNPRDWSRFYSDYVRTYIEKDVYDIVKVRDPNAFYSFLVCVASRTGSVLNYANIAKEVGVDLATVKTWIGVLERTGIVYLLQPYFNSHLSRAIKTPKIYFRDTGLCAYLTNWNTPEQCRDGAMSGAFFETFVVNEILKSFINAGLDYTHHIYYYRTKDQSIDKEGNDGEIDLIIEENNTLYPIKIKKNSFVKANMARCFMSLDKDTSKKRGTGAIICQCEEMMHLRDNLIALPIDFI